MNEGNDSAFPVEFSGNAREYFGIWIVNLLLSIVTLGIYSAWAKVRTKQYFYRNTSIAGRSFNYHATGVQILIARLIVLVALVVWSVLSQVHIYSAVLGLAFVFVLPWLLNRSLRFNAAVTSWSNVRFSFEGSYWAAFRVYLLYRFLSLLSLFLAYPYTIRATRRYVIGCHRFGGKRFSFDGGIGPFYRAALAVAAWYAFSIAVAFVVQSLVLGESELGAFLVLGGELDESQLQRNLEIYFVTTYVGLAIAFLPVGTIYEAFVRNAIYAGTRLEGGHRFVSNIAPWKLAAIAITNMVAIVVSLGLLLPWARIRVAHYLAAHSWVVPEGSLDEFLGAADEQQSAIGDAFADVGGFDVGAGI